MAEFQSLNRCLNPWILHLQKLALELKCPLCLNLLNQPILLPCDHIFCMRCIPKSTHFGSECPYPICKQQYVERDVRSVPFMENLVTIYRALDASSSATLFNNVSSDSGRGLDQYPVPVNTTAHDKLQKEPVEASLDGNSNNGQSISPLISNKCHASLNDGDEISPGSTRKVDKLTMLKNGKAKEVEMHSQDKMIPFPSLGSPGALKHQDTQPEEIDVNQVAQFSPSSPPSFGDNKDMDVISSDPDSSSDKIEKFISKRLKRLVRSNSDRISVEVNGMPISGADCYLGDVKRQKKLKCEFEMGVKINGHALDLHSKNLTTSNLQLESKSGEPCSSAQSSPSSASSGSDVRVCAFCHSSKVIDGSGPMLHYANGKEVRDVAAVSKAIHVHRKCIEWTPQVYYEGETIKNLEAELSRAAKLKCSSCGLKGAALGCFVKSCRRTYHVPCAYEIVECKWDTEEFLMLCPFHNSVKFPREKSKSRKRISGTEHVLPNQMIKKQSDFWAASPKGVQEWVLCGSALSSEEKYLVVKFASIAGIVVTKFWRPNVTHVIAATDASGACCRTLKVLMAILNGRWIIRMDWIKACMEAMHPVDEEPYEVSLDNHGCCDGPKTGRLKALNNAPKLFHDFKFYFSGVYVPAYKYDLINLVITAGGSIIESKEQLVVQSHGAQLIPMTTLVVYSVDIPQGCRVGEEDPDVLQIAAAAQELAAEIGSVAVRHTWILESIAACNLQNLPGY